MNALGTGKAEVLRGLMAGDRSGMVAVLRPADGPHDRRRPSAQPLPPLPPHLAEFDCRNNRLLAAALDEIAPSIAHVGETVGAHRVAVVIGTSTSGIAAGEDAIDALHREGQIPATFHYRQQEIGMAAEFAARYLGLTRRALHDLDGVLVVRERVRFGAAAARCRPLRRGRRRRRRQPVPAHAEWLRRARVAFARALQPVQRQSQGPEHRRRRGVFLMTRSPAAVRLCGIGESSDGYHMSAPDPEGRGAEVAIRAALAQAALEPSRRRLRQPARHRHAEE